MTQREIKLFKRFLKETGAYQVFINNYNESELRYGLNGMNIIKYLKTIPSRRVLMAAFGWLSSQEGGEFWAERDEKWHTYINK